MFVLVPDSFFLFLKVNGFHQGLLKLAMEPSFIGLAVMEGGPNRIIKLDKSPGVDEVICLLLYYLASILSLITCT